MFHCEIMDADEKDREFYTVINDQDYVVVTLVFESSEGDIVHIVSDKAGDKDPDAFVMNVLLEGLDRVNATEVYSV